MATRYNAVQRYPFVSWQRLKRAIRWQQGQHVLTVGATGSGKSTVAGEFLNLRKQVAVCVTKGMDPIFDEYPYNQYDRIGKWPPGRKQFRVLLWPPNLKTGEQTRDNKIAVFTYALDDILLRRGNWCIVMDEEHYASETLRLRGPIADILEQGRSAGISMWNNTQRPAGIPLATYVNSSHAFLFQAQEDVDVKRLASMSNRTTTAQELQYNLDQLESFTHHEFVYLDRTGRIPPVRSIVQKRGNNASSSHQRNLRGTGKASGYRLEGAGSPGRR